MDEDRSIDDKTWSDVRGGFGVIYTLVFCEIVFLGNFFSYDGNFGTCPFIIFLSNIFHKDGAPLILVFFIFFFFFNILKWVT